MAEQSSTEDINPEAKLELKRLRNEVAELQRTVNNLSEIMHGDEDAIDDRSALEDLRLLRMIVRRFQSFRFLFGVFVGAASFLATTGFAIYKLLEFLGIIAKTKTGG